MATSNRRRILKAAFFAAGCLLPAALGADWQVINTFHIGGSGGWDYLTPDIQTHRLYVPRTTHTLVIDEESGKVQQRFTV